MDVHYIVQLLQKSVMMTLGPTMASLQLSPNETSEGFKHFKCKVLKSPHLVLYTPKPSLHQRQPYFSTNNKAVQCEAKATVS